MLLVGSLVPSATTFLFIVGLLEFDPSPIGFAVMGLTFAAAIFRYRLLDVTPIARDIVLDNVDSGVLVLDRDDTIVDLNRSAREIIQMPDIRGTALESVFDSAGVDIELSGAHETSQTVSVDTNDGVRHFDVDVSPIYDSLDAYLGRVVIFTDDTDRIDRQRRLRERTAQLKRQNERLDQFASLVSHDLRNPLQIASGSLELARASDDDDLQRAEEALERMEDIIDELLLLARVGQEVTDPAPVDLQAVATDASQHVSTADSEVVVADRLPTVEADRDRLLHVFENLFRNAIDHNDDPVTITVGSVDDVTGFYVEDTGSGIPSDRGDEIFEEGYTTNSDGTGFGLSIVRDIVQAHGWTVVATDGEAGGARFEVTT
ncbi:ATP-binding protein [Halomicroarcula sp. GCM10025709]|uniref:sensor histidine kinase n=1 Tax=Halomicroarcula sp. GCM10025709 TaxID=3252669 RepID=UPI003610E072